MCEQVMIRFKAKARVCQTHLTTQTDSSELILQNIKDGLVHWENWRECPQKRHGRMRETRSEDRRMSSKGRRGERKGKKEGLERS